jgi:uncharacterized protein
MSVAAGPVSASARDRRIDALRAFALAGILQVNIQSFVLGAGSPLGEFITPPTWLDQGVYFLVSALVEYKFMPIFGLLFGAGFGLLWDRLPDLVERPEAVLGRRFAALLMFGFAHGVFLYYGDITNIYAVLGFLLLAVYRHADPARLARSVRRWWIASLLISSVLAVLVDLSGVQIEAADEAAALMRENFLLFTTASYSAQLEPRVREFANLTEAVYLYGQWVPIFSWILTGLLAQRAGWLTRLDAHPRIARAAVLLGLGIGLPSALAYAWLSLVAALDGPFIGDGSVRAASPELLLLASSLLAPMYVVLFLRYAPPVWVDWLAPAGRMPLSNYLLQSLAMGLLLSGWGFGWGAWMSQAELAGVAGIIVVVQWSASCWYLRRFEQGPLEAVWRKLTYAGVPLAPPRPKA